MNRSWRLADIRRSAERIADRGQYRMWANALTAGMDGITTLVIGLPRQVVVQRCRQADVDLVLRDDGAVWPRAWTFHEVLAKSALSTTGRLLDALPVDGQPVARLHPCLPLRARDTWRHKGRPS